ncbi:lysM and putative peptidoglycan-binding domain-containing protein 3 isoform X2 [Hyposmocoma kahamanoa]|uniref:lysM and putative peptidoglycan-binding domain-containing protein 3 isoform X2 n=1 Tax=Hyposmocoma kahamanoa TaxID=1477025 RepID=UPI000E6D5B9F|nr:lysM and putative peptidoglycan-binding domain-containing protein 3 isoform X2 [Hyposmocoma kahamanoa]
MKQRTRLMHGGDDLISYNMSKKTDGDLNGEIQLHKMKPQEHYIEAQVQEGDTLQAIALRFYCSIAELKRINHIHKDNEIFARRTIKVPVTPYSVLTELLPPSETVEPVPTTSSLPQNQSSIHELMNNTQNEKNESHNLPNNNTESSDDYAIDCNAVVLNSTLAPAVIPYTDIEQSEAITEDTQLLPNKKLRESLDAVVVKELTSHGADFGLKWYHLLGFVLIVGAVIPIVYIILTVENPEHHEVASVHKN